MSRDSHEELQRAAPAVLTSDPALRYFEAFLCLCITLGILIVNILKAIILFQRHTLRAVNRFFFSSLIIADVTVGLLVTPFSFIAAIYGEWVFGPSMCDAQAYFFAFPALASIYSLMLNSLDHYVAIRKPERYGQTLSPVRSMCWLIFCWLTALSFCCPPLFGVPRAKYYAEAYICIIDWELQKAHFVTSGVVVTVLPTIALVFANSYLLTKDYRHQKEMSEKFGGAVDDAFRARYYYINCICSILIFVVWFPWSVLMIDYISSNYKNTYPEPLHFFLMWTGLGNSIWRFIAHCLLASDFRCGLKSIFLSDARCTCKNSS